MNFRFIISGILFPSRLIAAIVFLCVLGSLPSNAQTASGSTLAREQAYAAIKSGNIESALLTLSGAVKRHTRAREENLQVAVGLVEIGCRLKNEGDPGRAAQVAALSLVKISAARSRLPSKDAAAAMALAGQVYDYILGDAAQARAAYVSALAVDPTLKHAVERVAHLDAVVARAKEKTAGNDLLRQRAASSRH